MSVSMYNLQADDRLFWIWKLKRGKSPEPKPAYVPIEEKYDLNAPKNIFREGYGRHRCPACGKPFFFIRSAWNCHPNASAYYVWGKFAHRGPAGSRSFEDAFRAEISSPYGAFGNYGGGPFGL